MHYALYELLNDEFLCHYFLKFTCFMIPLYVIYFKDNIPYNEKFSLGSVLNKLDISSVTLFEWLTVTDMKTNTNKCNLPVTCNEEIL